MWYDGFFTIPLTGGITGKVNREKLAKYKNAATFQNTFIRFLSDALSRYTFDGLPDTVSERVILQSLLWYGGVVFFEKNGSLLALPGAPTGDGFNLYGDPGSAWIFSRNGQLNEQIKLHIPGGDDDAFLRILADGRKTGKGGAGVYVWENQMRFPFIHTVTQYAEAVSDSMRTLDVVRQNLKHPYIIVADETVVPSIKEFFKKRDENLDYIIDSGVFPVDKIKILPLDAANTAQAKDVTELIEWYESKFRELCGIRSNSQTDKKGENLISDEVHINDDYEDLQVDRLIPYMQKQLDYVNKFYGTDIKVVSRKEQTNEDDDILSDAGQSGAAGDSALS